MPPIRLNRRRFLGCSAAAGLALSQGVVADAADLGPVRIGVVGLGNRGTALLRAVLELPGVSVPVLVDVEPKHRFRGQGIVEKSTGRRPDGLDSVSQLLGRTDVDAVVVALPCDLHADVGLSVLKARKHLYLEKPLAIDLADCDRLIAEAAAAPELTVHVGYQRRSNPRYREAVDLIQRGDLGELVSGSGAWLSSNGPMNGHGDWLARRERSGDWMVEQAVHVWDLLQWMTGALPARAFAKGRRDLFAQSQPGRDVTDHYAVRLVWDNGFDVAFTHSWIAPADDHFTGNTLRVVGVEGGIDLSSGALTFRDRQRARQVIQPGNHPDTRFALESFAQSVRTSGLVTAPVSLAEARDATLIGLLVRKAVDEERVVTIDEIRGGSVPVA